MKGRIISYGLILICFQQIAAQSNQSIQLQKNYLQTIDQQFQVDEFPSKLLDSTLTYDLEDFNEGVDAKLINTYDEFGRLTSYAYYDYFDGDYEKLPFLLYRITYAHRQRTTEKKIWNATIQKYERVSIFKEQFDGLYRLSEMIIEDWSTLHQAYIPAAKLEISYQGNDQFVLEQFRWTNNWFLEKEEAYIRINAQNFERHIKTWQSGMNANLFGYGKIAESYSADGQLVAATQFYLNQTTNIWTAVRTTNYFYNSNDRLKCKQVCVLAESIKDSISYIYENDFTEEKILTYRDEAYPSSFNIYALAENEYDADGDIVLEKVIDLNETLRGYKEYYYSVKDVLDHQVEILSDTEIVFENPLRSDLFNFELKTDNASAFNVAIRNQSGLSIYVASDLYAGQHSISFQDLPSGIYFLSLHQEGRSKVYKLLRL